MGETSISWTHRPGTKPRTWNPTQGCRRVSAGCERCYAERQARRFAGPGKPFDGLINLKTGKWTGEARLATHKLDEPLSWREPSTVFVDSMSDLFYERFTNVEIAAVFGVMAATPQHTYQILTKRADRMRKWFGWARREFTEQQRGIACAPNTARAMLDAAAEYLGLQRADLNAAWKRLEEDAWPLPNVWLGVSVENQEAADERIPELLKTPAAIRFLSCEPLLGPVDLARFVRCPDCGYTHLDVAEHLDHHLCKGPGPRLGWAIAGAESGPRARACSVEWLRLLRDQCAAAGVPYFLKQAVATECPVEDAPTEGIMYRGICAGEGSREKGRGFGGPVIELPYLDFAQHAEFPR